jgi:Xaa-Pro dipeptidase
MEMLEKSELAARLNKLQRWMQEVSIDAVFVFQNVDAFYFSGTAQSGLLCLPARGEPLHLVQKSVTRAQQESLWQRILPFPGFKKLAEFLKAEGIEGLNRIGMETDVLPAGYLLRLKESFPQADFVDASEAICRIRMIKSGHEVSQIRRAAQTMREALDHFPEWIHPGATELEVMAHLEGFLRSAGHQGLVRTRRFGSQIGYGTVSSGISANAPTHFPGPVGSFGLYPAVPIAGSLHRIAPGASIMLDFVGGYGGYHADMTRVFVLGELAQDMVEAHDFVLALLRDLERMLVPGTLCSQIYKYAVERIQNSPYAAGFMGARENQMRFVGHGIGLELDEIPVLAGGFDIPLETGMTIAVEPKIFFEERGGIGIENTYLITGFGFENLTPYREEVIAIECQGR